MTTRSLPPILASAHAWARRQSWLGRFTLANRLLLAMAFIPTGLVKATGQRFTAIPVSQPIGFFFEAMYQTGPYWIFIGVAQIAAGVLLLIPATATLGAVLFFPIIVSIVFITWGMGFTGTTYVTAAMLLSVVYLLSWDGDRIWSAGAHLVGSTSGRPLLEGATALERAGWLVGAGAGITLFLITRSFVPRDVTGAVLLVGAVAALMVVAGWIVGMLGPRQRDRAAAAAGSDPG